MQDIIIAHDLEAELTAAIDRCRPDRLFVLVDDNTRRLCLPRVERFGCLRHATTITIPQGDANKNLESVVTVWEALQQGGATRHSMLVNLGGGMVTDLGGFAASCFKRGISFVNIPTTLLSMVDASVGGKTGFNFGGLKNEIGVFNDPSCVIIDTAFLHTLDRGNILSGYAEMLKHGLINREGERMWADLMNFDIEHPDLTALGRMVAESVEVKRRIVSEDPLEHGIRKALNVGHTVGHALESWAMRQQQPVLHGYAVAWGIVAELYLSATKQGFPTDRMRQTVRFVREHYGVPAISCKDYPDLLELMTHDKKNTAGVVNFTLLSGIGGIAINQTATEKEITDALDFLAF